MTEDYSMLLGRRVKHLCGDANCNLEGTVISIQYFLSKTTANEWYNCWALVTWDKGVSGQLTTLVPAQKLKAVEVSE